MQAVQNINPFPNLTKWTMPSSYFGQTWFEYYEILGQCRDSDILARANFASLLNKLGGESKTVVVNRCSHWAVGWVETIMIHESDLEKLKLANEIMGKYNDYPVIDDEDYSDLEFQSYSDYATQEQDDLAEFLMEVFSIPEEAKEETVKLAYNLNLEAQFQGGENSCFNHNIYAFNREFDFETKQLERLLESSDVTYRLDEKSLAVVEYIKACLGQ